MTLIWHQNLMAGEALANPEAIDLAQYQQIFKTARKEQTGPLTVPWPIYGHQRFWELYLAHWHALPTVTPREARRALVPLRAASPVALSSEDPETAAWSEGFLHPWGSSLVITLTVDGEWSGLGEVADRLIELREQRLFQLDGAAASVDLEAAATAGLEALAELASKATRGRRWDPFTICTLMEAEGEMTAFDPAKEATTAARFLQAITSFSPNWRLDASRPLQEAKVAGIADAPASHLVYGIRRARAIWSPANFLPTEGKGRSTVGCHHRNLVLASMQTEALTRFVEDTAARLRAGTELSSEQRTQAGWAVRILEALYRGVRETTYRSGSVKTQIEQDQLLDSINAVRAEHELPALP